MVQFCFCANFSFCLSIIILCLSMATVCKFLIVHIFLPYGIVCDVNYYAKDNKSGCINVIIFNALISISI